MLPWRRMAENNGYANETLWTAILELPAGGFTARAPGFFPSLAETMNHIHVVDLYYLDALEERGRGRAVYDQSDERDPVRLAKMQMDIDQRFVAFAGGLSPEALLETRGTERADGIVTETVADLFLHLVQHQVHHRGQAHVQLSSLGADPPQLDDFYLNHGRVPVAKRWRRT